MAFWISLTLCIRWRKTKLTLVAFSFLFLIGDLLISSQHHNPEGLRKRGIWPAFKEINENLKYWESTARFEKSNFGSIPQLARSLFKYFCSEKCMFYTTFPSRHSQHRFYSTWMNNVAAPRLNTDKSFRTTLSFFHWVCHWITQKFGQQTGLRMCIIKYAHSWIRRSVSMESK